MLALLSLPVFAQALVPGEALVGEAPAAAAYHLLDDARELPVDAPVWTAGVVELRAAPTGGGKVVARLPVATRAVVLEDMGAWVEVRAGGKTGWVARERLSTMGRVADLDGDGAEERIVVARTGDGATRAWLREGEVVREIVLYPHPEPSLGAWDVVPADEAGVTLLRVELNQQGCGAYPSVWLSYAGDELRAALSVVPWADGAYGESYEVRFPAPGVARVRHERYGELAPEVSERACVLTSEGVFRCG